MVLFLRSTSMNRLELTDYADRYLIDQLADGKNQTLNRVGSANPASPIRLRVLESSMKVEVSPLYRSAVDRADITHSV